MSQRTDKISSTMHRELSQLFVEVLDEYNYGIVSVVGVRVLEDLSEARVTVSCLKNADQFVSMLNKRSGYIRRTISPRLPMRRLPKLIFSLDTSGKQLETIEQLLRS